MTVAWGSSQQQCTFRAVRSWRVPRVLRPVLRRPRPQLEGRRAAAAAGGGAHAGRFHGVPGLAELRQGSSLYLCTMYRSKCDCICTQVFSSVTVFACQVWQCLSKLYLSTIYR